jgi:biopolymer transport protein ExbD
LSVQIQETGRRRPSINVTPLIDVLFLLLTFFLVTTTFIEQSALKVELPKMSHADKVQQERRYILEVASDGRMRYDGEPMDRATLRARLLGSADEINSGGGVMLRADQLVSHGEVVAVLDLMKEAGVRRFVIATAGQD